jgi:hypothetical protein
VSITVLQEKCDPKEALDKKLPYTAYLVEYTDKDNLLCYDIAVAGKAVDLFDYYYDKYKKGFKKLTQTEGRLTPSQWTHATSKPSPPPKKKKGKPKPPPEASA